MEHLEGTMWKKRSALSKAGWDHGAVISMLCVPTLRQVPPREQNLEQGDCWQLFLILPYLPGNGVKPSRGRHHADGPSFLMSRSPPVATGVAVRGEPASLEAV